MAFLGSFVLSTLVARLSGCVAKNCCAESRINSLTTRLNIKVEKCAGNLQIDCLGLFFGWSWIAYESEVHSTCHVTTEDIRIVSERWNKIRNHWMRNGVWDKRREERWWSSTTATTRTGHQKKFHLIRPYDLCVRNVWTFKNDFDWQCCHKVLLDLKSFC